MVIEIQNEDIELLKNMIDATPVAMQMVGSDGLFCYINPATISLFRAKGREDFIGKTPTLFSPEKQRDGTSSREGAEKYIEQAFTGQAVSFKWDHLRFDGSLFLCQVTLKRIEYQGTPCLMTTLVDLTDIASLLRKTDVIINNSPISIMVIRPDLSVQEANPAFSQMSGYTDNQLSTMKMSDFQVTKRTGGSITEAIDSHAFVSGDVEFLAPAGTRNLQYKYVPIFDDNGVLTSVINYYIDKTLERTAVQDIITLTGKCQEGRLDTRLDTSQYSGDLRVLTEEINGTLDSIIAPLTAAARYFGRIAKGDIPPKITKIYKGDFNEITNNLNQCVDAVNYLTSDIKLLSDAAVNGNLETRVDPTKHQGEFRKIVEGMNDTLNAVTIPLHDAGRILERMAVNDYSTNMAETVYKGDFSTLANNINLVRERINHVAESIVKIGEGDLTDLEEYRKVGRRSEQDQIVPGYIKALESLQKLTYDTEELVQAAAEGRLDTRADATKHQGEFRKIVEGINNTLKAVITPLHDADRVLERMALNDNSTGMAENRYKGDFATLASNINLVRDRQNHIAESIVKIGKGDLSDLEEYRRIGRRSEQDRLVPGFIKTLENLQALTHDTRVLIQAATEGRLDSRADVSRHEGEYRQIVDGINNILDAVIDPLNMAAEYIDRIAKGEIPEKITATYNGDFNEIKNNLNQCIVGLGGLVECNAVLQRMALNDHTKNVEGKYPGIYGSMSEATNDVLTRLLAITSLVQNISTGNTSLLEKYQKIGRRCDNDILVPAFIHCMENIQLLIADTRMMSDAAIKGDLDKRADPSLHEGDFRTIIEGFNETFNSVIIPVQEAIRVSKEYAGYNFTARVDSKLKFSGDWAGFKIALDNIGMQISDAISLINKQIIDLASNAEEATASIEEVSAGAHQIAKNTGGVSINAEQGDEGIVQVLKAMEDLTVTVSEVSQRAEKVSTSATHANEFSKTGIELAHKSESAMTGITNSTNEVDLIVKEINKQMEEIGKIVRLITDISNQTNLLALNAAIEAARAGDAGRGFAVVAAEVKSLAQDSRRSAENIADMISTLQEKARKANEAMVTAGIAVREGSRALEETMGAFNQIATSVEDITKNSMDVAAASEEQAASVEEVTASINEVSGLIQNTAREAADAAAATQEASASIEQISKVVSNVSGIADSVSRGVAKFRVNLS
jgi:methyl-accepting chemotaxis protein